MGLDAATASSLGGIATVSLVHSLIPSHWLPFCLVAKAQKWSLRRTLAVTALGATLHVISTSLLGLAARFMAHSLAGEELVNALAALLLMAMGGSYIGQFLRGHRAHCHHHQQQHLAHQSELPRDSSGKLGGVSRGDSLAALGVVLVPALSPCASTLPVFLSLQGSSPLLLAAAASVLLLCTVAAMVALVALSLLGTQRMKLHWLEKQERLLVGCVLVTVGLTNLLFHHHHHLHQHQHSDTLFESTLGSDHQVHEGLIHTHVLQHSHVH